MSPSKRLSRQNWSSVFWFWVRDSCWILVESGKIFGLVFIIATAVIIKISTWVWMPALPFLICVIFSELFDSFQTQLLYKVRMVIASFLDLTLWFVLQDSYFFMISVGGPINLNTNRQSQKLTVGLLQHLV